MTRIRYALWGLLLGMAVLWFFADSLLPRPFGYFPFRAVFVQFTGVLAITAMSAAMVLAVRPAWLQRHLGGLDKMYRLHRWLGISALAIGAVHWWFAQGTKWMVGWGWLQRPVRGHRGAPPEGFLGWLASQRGLAEDIGEWAFYAFVVLALIALAKRVPYELFRKTHKVMLVVYPLLAWHAFVLTKPAYWTQPVGWALAVLLLAGVASTAWILAGRLGSSRKVVGRVASIDYHPQSRVMEIAVELGPAWPGHRAGQFAFLTTDTAEGAHPFTMASAWPDGGRMLFVVKALGDHTAHLREQLTVGQQVLVEGPYGCFDFDDGRSRQIWIGAGIGITPFIARMRQLSREGRSQRIDLYHSVHQRDPTVLEKLADDAKAAGITLHLHVTGETGERLRGARIRGELPDWQQASVWFCGPSDFGTALRADFLGHGLPREAFHQELFEFR